MGKVTRPTLPEVYAREKLFKTLDRLRQQPVIWISGPGGKDPATFFITWTKPPKELSPRRKILFPR